MKRVIHKRTYGSETATMGHFYFLDKRIMSILEPPWKYNEPNVSCIPSGIYVCHLQEHVQENGNRYPAYQIMEVPDRTNIEIHIGNKIADTLGCLIEGLVYSEKDEQVLESAAAHKMLLDLMGGEDFILEIVDCDRIKRMLALRSDIKPRLPNNEIDAEPITLPPVPEIDVKKTNKVTMAQKTWLWLNEKKRLIGFGLMGIGWVLKKLPDATINLAGNGIEVAGSALAAVGLVHAEVKKVNGVDVDTFWEKAWRWIKQYIWPLILELTKKK
jgi:hypothetical protein